jgi:hypothetical protein
VINGQRTTFTNVTLDGINIQDNFIRTNAVDFSPNLLLLDQVAEMTVSTSNTNPAAGGGASQLIFVSPSGTNTFHGGFFWSNRNNALAANTWFNNRDKIAKPFLNQNQTGANVGGRIIKDKLFFFVNFEAFRSRQQSAQNRTILTPDAAAGKTIAVWGLAFKPNTDDMREAPSRVVIQELLERGATICAYDPVAMSEARRIFRDETGLSYAAGPLAALDGADGLIIVTEWKEFRSPDFAAIKQRLKQPLVFDGRNLYDPKLVAAAGLEYFPIGRGLSRDS